MNRGIAAFALVALSAACATERRVMLIDETCVARSVDGSARALVFGEWYVARGSGTALAGCSSDELELVANDTVYGRVSSDCVAAELPFGETRYVGTAGAEIYAAPNRATIAGRLAPLTEVRVVRDDGAVQLVGADGITVGFVRSILLTDERRMLGDVALDLHWLLERGQRKRVAEQLALLDEKALVAPEVRELACRVAYGGLTDPAWVERLHAKGCPNRPAFADQQALGVAPLECAGKPRNVVGQTSSMSTAWACVGKSTSARVFVSDLDGRTVNLGEVIVPLAGACPAARIVAVHPVGLGACVEAVVSDMGCADATGAIQRALFCLPPPLVPAPKKHAGAIEILTAFKRFEREGLAEEDCVASVDEPAGQPDAGGVWDTGGCVITRERSGALASHHLVRIDGDYVLCVRGAHEESGPHDVAFRWLPGRIEELRQWPSACNTDDGVPR